MDEKKQPDIILIGEEYWISPYTFTAFVALKEKGLKFKIEDISLAKKEHKSDDFIHKTITSRVPSIKIGDFTLAESSAIVEYLEELFPASKGYPSLFPSSLEHRARARQLLHWIRSDLMPVRTERDSSSLFYEGQRAKLKPLTQSAEESAEKIKQVAELLLHQDGSPLFGEWSIADADFAFLLQRLVINGDKVSDKITKYVANQWKRPSVAEFANHERKPFVPYHY